MIPELDATDIGRQLGADGVNGVVTKVEQYCAYAEQRIALKNHPSILGLRAELSLLRDCQGAMSDGVYENKLSRIVSASLNRADVFVLYCLFLRPILQMTAMRKSQVLHR